MGIFTRGGSKTDPDFTFLTADEGYLLRSLAAEAFARKGVAVAKNGDHLTSASGQLFGLHSLAVQIHGIQGDLTEWIPVVESHVRTLLATSESPARGV